MDAVLVSRELIARQAAAAARRKADGAEKPPNPYCEILEPAHHAEWEASYERELHQLTAPEGAEGSA